MRNTYDAPEVKIIIFAAEDVITASGTWETDVPYDGTNWGTDGSWMNGWFPEKP